MAEMILRCGTTVYLDDIDLPKVSGLKWYLDKQGYAARKATIDGKRGRIVLMHRAIFGAVKGEIVDHIDNVPLNNSRANLRLASISQNTSNSRKRDGLSSRYKGVTWNKSCGKWQAQIKANRTQKYLGIFDTEDEAGHAYNKAAIAAFGEFARLNPVGAEKGQQNG